MANATAAELDDGLAHVQRSPRDVGRVRLVVRRPAIDRREELDQGTLDPTLGLVGDTWVSRGSRRTADGSADPDAQVTIINARLAVLVARERARMALAGDQLFVDFDLSHEHVPAGARLAIGLAVVEVSAHPHTGCAKFAARYGAEALRFVNSPVGRALRLRGLNARIVAGGPVRVGDEVRRLDPPALP